ncbi:hypothetical protein [Chitinophaga sp. MM2321]|uniref:hypothetical protein n=1 Tax=Chitinophaga sp. MM2321 TaxID=3137178 RepID=UPI0032D58E79
MYQIHADIFRKIALYVNITRQFKDDIKGINVSNEIEEHFGKTYCRVYINIELKEDSTNSYKLYQSIQNDFYRYGEKDYFSFHLRTGWRDSEELLQNIREHTHYDYIWNLLYWHLQKDGIKVKEEMFKSQWHLRNKRQEQDEKWQQKRNLIEDAVDTVSPEVGQLIATRQWRGSPLRIGIVENVIVPNKRQSFSLELSELKKDLTPGKIKMILGSKTEIYAIVRPHELPNGIGKAELLASIERGDDIRGLMWRRPHELWE